MFVLSISRNGKWEKRWENTVNTGKKCFGIARAKWRGMKRKTLYSLLAIATVFTAGCSRTDLTTEVKDTRGVTKQSPVVLESTGQTVGRVQKVVATESGFRLDMVLDKPHRNTLRADAKACPSPRSIVSDKPTLLLIGGNDPSFPVLKRGTLIHEAQLGGGKRTWWEWIAHSQRAQIQMVLTFVSIVLTVIILVIKIIKNFVKLAIVAILAIVIIYGVTGLRSGWSLERISSISSEKVRTWLNDNMGKLEGKSGFLNDINFNIIELNNEL